MSRSTQDWTVSAIGHLLDLRGSNVGWGYQAEGAAYTEPTVLACLALLAASDDHPLEAVAGLVRQSADWLADLQQPDGAVGISAELPKPRWPTAFAALLWSQLADYEQPLARSLRWLQQREGLTFAKSERCVAGYDTNIPGWPWVAGTQPWLEPTGMAMLALCRNQLAGHQRIRDGARMILDRTVAKGGWNVGDSLAPGRPTRPQCGPTGIALLALRAALQEETAPVARACEYLLETLPLIRDPETLGWGLLGLRAWRPAPSAADDWLHCSFDNALAVRHSPQRLSMLLLAASSTSLSRLGVQSAVGDEMTPASGGGQEQSGGQRRSNLPDLPAFCQ